MCVFVFTLLPLQFLKMCAMLHIDPISNNQTFLGSLLGIGTYYYSLALKTAEVCIATRERNGGVISVTEIRSILRRKEAKKAKGDDISADDVVLAVSKLKCLGGGFRILNRTGSSDSHNAKTSDLYVVSVPMELNADHVAVVSPRLAAKCAASCEQPSALCHALSPFCSHMRVAQINLSVSSPLGKGCVNVSYIMQELGWTKERCLRCIETMKIEGVCWEDEWKGMKSWWFMSVWNERDDEEEE